MSDHPATVLADDIQQAKQLITSLGRQIFRISSNFAELTPEQRSVFRDLAHTHELMANETVAHAQMAEFYKASVGYIELLQQINEKVLENAGIGQHQGNSTG